MGGSRPESQGSVVSGKSRATARNSVTSATSSQLNEAVSELKGFNSQLKDELMELKGYLQTTNERLATLERDGSVGSGTGRKSTARSRSSMAYSERMSTGRSQIRSVISD